MTSYTLFAKRLVPGRASPQAWVMALLTVGLLALFPMFAAQIFFDHVNTAPEEISEIPEGARPDNGINGMITIPSHLSGYGTRAQNNDRIVFGLSLGEILKNIGSDIGPGFGGDAIRQQITLTFFRPDQSTFNLSGFFRLYGEYLVPEKHVGENGLTTQRFLRDGPFDNEILRFETGYNRNRYFIRCFKGAKSNRVSTCFRNVRLSSDVALRYSFDERLLTNWVGLESVVISLAERMIAGQEHGG